MSIKSLGKQSLVYGIGHVLARLITFLLLPLYTNTFNQEEYGAISLAYAFIGFALIIYRHGMDTALMKFSVQTAGDERIKYITTIILSQTLTGILFTFLIYITRSYTAIWVLGTDRPEWMVFLCVILFLDCMWNLPLLILRSEERAVPFISLSLINVITTMVLNIIFVVYKGQGIEGVFRANIIASGLSFFLSAPIIFNRTNVSLFDKKTLKKIFYFSLPFLPAGIFTMVMELSDRYILEWLIGTAEVGLYSAGKKMGMLGLTVVMAFNMGWTPYFLKRGKEPGSKFEFAKITTYFLGFMSYVCIIVSLWIADLMKLSINGSNLIGPEFWDSQPIVKLILFGYFFFGAYVVQLPGVYIKEITNWVPVFRLTGAITLIISCILLIPYMGYLGAAYSVVIAFFMMTISIYTKTNKLYPIAYNWRGILIPTICLFMVQIDFDSRTINLVISILYPFFWYLFALNNFEKEDLMKAFK
tara:strand:- start:2221 stop:3639 length:1419 start_codon:yes stop_codon:yes gene_type:complete